MTTPTFTQQTFLNQQPPPGPPPQPAPPPVVERRFYLVEPKGGYQQPVGPLPESQVISDWISKGWDGPLFLIGGAETNWKDAKFYGLAMTPPAPAAIAPPVVQQPIGLPPLASPQAQPVATQQPIATPQPAIQPQAALPAATVAALPTGVAAKPTVASLLKAFSKLPGCEDYKNDGPRVKLLSQYLWIRLLTPGLSFEQFLELFANVADYDDENRKHPDDALKYHCPRTGKRAEEVGRKWSADEIVEYVSLYVDMIREAEEQQTPVPLTFDQFLPALRDGFLAGDFKAAPEPVEKKSRKAATVEASQVAIAPTAVGQRIVYTMPTDGGRQLRGKVDALQSVDSRTYVTFTTDAGELFENVNIQHCSVIEDTALPGHRDATGAALPELERRRMLIPKNVQPQIAQALALKQALGNVAIGDGLHTFTQGFSNNYEASISVINGESGPFVNAEVYNTINQQFVPLTAPPRSNIEGTYTFALAEGLLVLEVAFRE